MYLLVNQVSFRAAIFPHPPLRYFDEGGIVCFSLLPLAYRQQLKVILTAALNRRAFDYNSAIIR
jgi:hypothetical protein